MKSISRKNYQHFVPYSAPRQPIQIDWSPVFQVLVIIVAIMLAIHFGG